MATIEDLGAKVKAKHPGSYDDIPNAELGRKVKAKFPGSYDDFTEAPPAARSESLIGRAKKDAEMGWKAGAADLAHTAGNIASAIPIPASREFGRAAEEYARKEAPTQQDLDSHQGVMDQMIQGVTQIPSQVAKFAPTQLLGKYGPLAAGAVGAASEMDKGWKPALKAGAITAAQFWASGKAGGIKRLVPRMAANAAIMAAPTAVESGGDINKTVAAGGMGAVFGIPSHGEKMTRARAREALKGGMDTAAALKDEVQSYFSPQERSHEAGISGRVFRERLAEMHIDNSRAEFAMREARKAFSKMPPEQINGFYAAIEGDAKAKADATPQMRGFVDAIRKGLDAKRDQVTSETGRLKSFYADYFPHIWADEDKAADFVKNFYASKRPLSGGGGHFRERTIPTIAAGLEAGLKLAHDNPVDAYLALHGELNRFLMAKRVIKDLRPESLNNPQGRSILKFVAEGERIPSGYQEVNDPAFRVSSFGPKRIRAADTTSITTDIDPNSKGELVTPIAKPRARAEGKWVAPEPVARIFNNYLSKGLSKSMIYRGLRTVGNTINQAQLGLSAFHAGFTSVDSAISRYALGVEQLVQGMRAASPKMIGKGIASVASTPIAPITNAIKGWDLRRALLDPQKIKNPEMRQMVDLAIQAGARADSDPVYKNNLWSKMRDSFQQDKPLLGALRLPGALIERSAAPLMDHFVPWQKLGVFADLARFEMEKLDAKFPEGVPRDQQVEAVQKAWNSVDNRMGQLVYDNLFWDKTAKDLGMLGIRSVGWNIGTIREIVGGVKDWGSFFKDAASKGKQAEFTHRMAYVTALPMVVGMMGAITNYLATGQGPQSWKDYVAPRTGRKDETGHDERIWFPSYIKELYHYGTDPLGTISNKIHPMFSMVGEMLHNETFSGVEIRNKDDSLVQQLLSEAGYVAESMSPISMKTAMGKDSAPDARWWQRPAAFVGVVAAPMSLKKSTAENYATTVMAGTMGKRARTEEEDKSRTALRQINAAVRAKTDVAHLIDQYTEDGTLSPAGIVRSIKRGIPAMIYSPLYKDVARMGAHDAMSTYARATPEERAILWMPDPTAPGRHDPMILEKVAKKLTDKDLGRNDRDALLDQWKRIMKLPRAMPGGKQ